MLSFKDITYKVIPKDKEKIDYNNLVMFNTMKYLSNLIILDLL